VTTVVAQSLGLGPGGRALEVGVGFGRFTLALLGRCESFVASDLALHALEAPEHARDE
jgi:16S rRNA A1518/A1519 N6-dimethyltransferase RsmA/KsgA/DIM1 with predicted DNA glycosylase/AP lyase activity